MDVALSPRWRLSPGVGLDYLAREVFAPGTRREVLEAAGCVLANALAAGEADREVSYSRNTRWYAARRGFPWGYRALVGAVDWLVEAGILGTWKAPRIPGFGRQSTFWAPAPLLEVAREHPDAFGVPTFDESNVPALELRDAAKRPKRFRENDAVRAMRFDVLDIRAAVLSADVRLAVPAPLGVARLGKANVYTQRCTLRRIFHENFKRGGRFYGHWIQSVPGRDRTGLVRIDGEPVVELDFVAMHPTIAYARAGVCPPANLRDYALPGCDGFPRSVRKAAVLALLNAESPRAAVRSLADAREKPADGRKRPVTYREAVKLVEAAYEAHWPLAGQFGTDAGASLMRQDSDMANQIMLGLARRGIVALAVHDSFLVKARHADELREAMVSAFEQSTGKRVSDFPYAITS